MSDEKVAEEVEVKADDEKKVAYPVKVNPDGPKVLVLGGCGFIGRNLVAYLAANGLCSFIKVVDKCSPQISFMHPRHKAAFDEKELVKFQQCDLAKPDHVQRAFEEKDTKFDYVVNLCGETRFGMDEKEYKLKIVDPAILCGKAAQEHGVKKFVELSSAQVYNPSKSPSDESGKCAPWTKVAQFRFEAEGELKKVDGLPLVILRPAIVYGSGDRTGIMPRVNCAAVYQYEKRPMKFLWGKDLRTNVVHVNDVVEAIWVACTDMPAGSLYNLSDESHLTQGELNGTIGKLFNIEIDFFNAVTSTMAMAVLSSVADQANEEHVPGFAKLCMVHEIANTPLDPFIDKELLHNNHLSVNGTKITTETSFKYKHKFSEDLLREQIQDFIDQKLFPPLLSSTN